MATLHAKIRLKQLEFLSLTPLGEVSSEMLLLDLRACRWISGSVPEQGRLGR